MPSSGSPFACLGPHTDSFADLLATPREGEAGAPDAPAPLCHGLGPPGRDYGEWTSADYTAVAPDSAAVSCGLTPSHSARGLLLPGAAATASGDTSVRTSPTSVAPAGRGSGSGSS